MRALVAVELSPTVAQRIDALPETAAVTRVRELETQVDGVANGSAVDPAHLDQTVDFDVRSGSLDRLGAHEVAVQVDEAKDQHLTIGDTVTFFFPETGNQEMTVVALSVFERTRELGCSGRSARAARRCVRRCVGSRS